MAKKSINAAAEEILRILDETPDTPATKAQAALDQARDAGDGGLRQQHLHEAQYHIGCIDPRREPQAVRRLNAQVLALQGRGGDTEIAHVTPGEFVIPAWMQTPEVMRYLENMAREHGVDPATLHVASGRNRINPRTGQMEFAAEQRPLPPLRSLDGFRGPPESLLPEPGSPRDRAFSFSDIPMAGGIIFAEGGNQPTATKERIAQSMVSRVGAGFGMPNTLAGVMTQERNDGKGHQYEGLDNPRFTMPLDQMSPPDQRAWVDSMATAANSIIDAKFNGVDYGPRFFRDVPQYDAQGRALPAHRIEFEDRQPPGARYRTPFPKR